MSSKDLKSSLINVLVNSDLQNLTGDEQRSSFLNKFGLQELIKDLIVRASISDFLNQLIELLQKDKDKLLGFLLELSNSDEIGQEDKKEITIISEKILALNARQWNEFKGSNSSTKQDLNPQELREREEIDALLNKVKNSWITGVLNPSLDYKKPLPDLDIQLKELPNAVKQGPGFDVFDTPRQISSENIINEFIEMGDGARSLLILGEPGSGKTTILLKLLAELIDNFGFGKDSGKPVPVVFNLSSWTRQQENFANWLVKELNQLFDTPLPKGEGILGSLTRR